MTLNNFFVYGTLRPGEVRWTVLAPYVVGEPQSVILPQYALFTNGVYPFVVKDGASNTIGELITVDNVDEVIRRLDMIEGYDPDDVDEGNVMNRNNLFNREKLYVWPAGTEEYTHETGTKVWVYTGGYDLIGSARNGRYRQIESGDWKQR
jgi:gamma-glutamylcyclotransferase (GGCT)/AIG2-like uncharacterized protein YtfP